MKDRFNLEEEISTLYSISDQLATVCEAILEDRVTQDEIVNAIEGIRVIVNLQTHKLLDTMCQVLKLNSYKDHQEYI